LVNYSGSVAPLIAVLCGAFAWIVVAQMRYPEFTELDAHIRLSLTSQPAVLRNQIAIRKATGELERAQTATELWACLSHLLGQLGFAEARCEVRDAAGDLTHEFDWKCASSSTGSAGNGSPGARYGGRSLWALEIPLSGAVGTNGVLRLGHAFDRRAPLFRMQSLVQLVAENFASALMARLSDPRPAAPLVARESIAQASWKAAAGARR
jgi:hypothetical protein